MAQLPELTALFSLSLFSLYDLKYRLVPGVELLLLAAVLLSAPADPVNALVVVAALAWSLLYWNKSLAIPLFFYPPAWVTLIVGYGYRVGVIGRADVIAIAALSIFFPFPAIIAAGVGLEIWRRWWNHRKLPGPIPALPGFLLGVAGYFLVATYVLRVA